ncbi:MAG: YihY/virulence factor BrkB family protein [Ginsengibacter sp.]
MKKKITFKGLWKVIKNSFSGFSEDKITKKSASLAYYTVFSLGPLLIVIVFLASVFLEREAVEGTIYSTMNQFIGSNAALQLQEMIKNTAINKSGTLAIVVGSITLLIGATTVFADMQDSINSIWGLKAKPKSGIVKLIKDRLLSFGVVASLGFLLLVSLGVSAIIDALNDRLTEVFPGLEVTLVYIGNMTISFIIITLLFMIIFKVLPDAKIKWKDVLSGSIATAILFMVGKFGISFYIRQADIGSSYGTAGSLVVVLVWIYYSSIILYFGAEFTKAFAVEYGSNIHPNEYSVISKTMEIEMEGSVQDAEKEIKKKRLEQQKLNEQKQNKK